MKNTGEYLEPEDSLFTGIFMPKYFVLVVSALEEAYKEDVRVRVLVFPSFSPEYAVGIRENSEIFTIFRLSLVKQLWGYISLKMMRDEPPKVIKNGKSSVNNR